ncbi:uncharacterized protein TM35_000072330 [Trypanosoma theileri]|uniref:Uncharacterized protein n=1 Tax=Trypanosoma theileri TaxID=67003 RepID=A0A1X0P2N2_9TRYP|nr:uncharacterized protein TM35_000072330 [Trypanosoma theileri]ORC90809.1 hypothetical protein TM35_000072330 [Trypanosoma theileri]
MEPSVLLQRQMELHGTLRRPPHTPAQLTEVHVEMQELARFFQSVRNKALKLRTPPETVFQCLMHIDMGDVVSFDKQRRDGAVPMHQAKVLARTSAIELEPRLRGVVSNDELNSMMSLCKKTRTLLRIKVEDGNDFSIAESALHQFIEYLDFIDNASERNPDKMFKFYMVEDEASLLLLLGRRTPYSSCPRYESDGSPVVVDGTATAVPPLPSERELEGEVRRVALVCGSSSESAGSRLTALRTLEYWLTSIPDTSFHRHLAALASLLTEPLAVCGGEKRSAICRQACAVLMAVAARTSPAAFHDGPLRSALGRWIAVLLRGVVVTVAAIANATDAAVRALVIASGGHSAGLRSIAEALTASTHPELRRRCLAYIALGVVASHGECAAAMMNLPALAQKYMEVGDAASRKMARALHIALTYLGTSPAVVGSKKTESLIQQETIELREALNDVELFESIIFGSTARRRLSGRSSLSGSTAHYGDTPSSSTAEMKRSFSASMSTGIYDTSATLVLHDSSAMQKEVQQSPDIRWDDKRSGNNSSTRRSKPHHHVDQAIKPTKSPEQQTVKLSASLRRKIEDATSCSLSRN